MSRAKSRSSGSLVRPLPGETQVDRRHRTTVETKNGNQVSRKGDAEDPAVVIDAGKSKAVKLAHELN